MKCYVTIRGSRDSEEVRSDGEITFDDRGFEVKYSILGDRCSFAVRGNAVTQSRRGVNTDITFVEGRDTVCMLLSGELTGSIPVKTVLLEILSTATERTVNIDYYLGGAEINLRLTAHFSPKETL